MQTEAHSDRVNDALEEYVAAWNAADADRIAALFAENGRYGGFDDGSVLDGRDQIAGHFRGVFTDAPDLRLDVVARPLYATDRVFFKWIMRGTTSGTSFYCLNPGTPFELQGATVLVFADGSITRAADLFELRNARGRSSGESSSLFDGLPSTPSLEFPSDPLEDNISYGE
jgi:steroid delta-isomerase-like uncharacterized protein